MRLLHAVASAPTGSVKVGELAVQLGISQSTCSHHVRKLSEVGFLVVDRVGNGPHTRLTGHPDTPSIATWR